MATDKSAKRQANNGMRSMSARLARSLTGGRGKINPVLDPLMSIQRNYSTLPITPQKSCMREYSVSRASRILPTR